MNYFFDNCISFRHVEMLKSLAVDAHALKDEFDQEIKDVPLFQALTGRDIVFVTQDSRQTTRQSEARELRKLGITCLWIEPFYSRLKFWDQAAWLVTRWPRIEGFAKGAAKGTYARIKQNGRCELFQL